MWNTEPDPDADFNVGSILAGGSCRRCPGCTGRTQDHAIVRVRQMVQRGAVYPTSRSESRLGAGPAGRTVPRPGDIPPLVTGPAAAPACCAWTSSGIIRSAATRAPRRV